MERHGKEKKSTHLKELEEVFEKRTRRFSPFEILGLTREQGQETAKGQEFGASDSTATPPLEETDPGVGPTSPPTPGADRPTYGSPRPTSGSLRPIPGMGRPTKVVVEYKNTTTTEIGPIPGMGPTSPPTPGAERPTLGPLKPTPGSSLSTHSPVELVSGAAQDQDGNEVDLPDLRTLQLADAVVATQLGSQLGKKARQVLAYLNRIRSLDYEAYTVPVGYGQISVAAGVDADYLRRKVLPKLAMLGLIGIARKSLEGTIYHLPYGSDYVRVVTSELIGNEKRVSPMERAATHESSEQSAVIPQWIDRERWGWLSPESIQRLVEKAGSEARAKEKLDIIVYNETHGALEQRVRNRRSVLAHYLASPQAEIWPNDNGFETLEIRQASLDRDRARREKALAEEALLARQEADRTRFLSSLSEAQLRWLKKRAKRQVDGRPESKFLQSRYPLYKVEEDKLVREWMDRAAYGENVPETEEEPSQ